MYPTDVFFRMANRYGRRADGRYGEDADPELYGNDSVGLFSPWTGRGDHGDGRGIDSSLPFPSSDPFPMLHVPSVGPGVRYTARSVPLVQTSSHTDTSISNTHVYVGQIETAGSEQQCWLGFKPLPPLPCSLHILAGRMRGLRSGIVFPS